MKIWLLEVGEPIPLDGSQHRLMRYGILAEMLQAAGHEVTWWTSSFNHQTKQFRSTGNYRHVYNNNYSCWLLNSNGYSKNVSLKRMIDHYEVARNFYNVALTEDRPDIILSGLPTIDLCYYALKYGEQYNVPVVVDVQDLWPDVFLDVLPSQIQRIGKFFLFPYYHALRTVCRKAYSIIGLTDNYIDWGIKHSDRSRNRADRVFPLAYSPEPPDVQEIVAAEEYWESKGLSDTSNKFIIVFIGTLGKQFDIPTVVNAAKKISNNNILFVLCGDGEEKSNYQRLANGSDNILFTGWIDKAKIWTIMRKASIGLAPYKNTNNFINNIPNKPIEYLSAGLPVLTCIDGVLSDLLHKYRCGQIYKYGDTQSLITSIDKIYESGNLLAEYSDNATKLYKSSFDSQKVYNSLIDYLKDICIQKERGNSK